MLLRHALRNAVISTVSVLGVNIGFLVGGTVIIEQVFALPGIGQLMINSILQRDFPVVQGVTLVFGIMVVFVYLRDRHPALAARPQGEVRLDDHRRRRRHAPTRSRPSTAAASAAAGTARRRSSPAS